MFYFQKAFPMTLLSVMILVFLLSCAKDQHGVLQSKRQSPLHFAMESQGLPQEGLWKSNISFVDINADGIVDMAATSRLGDGVHIWIGDGLHNWKDSFDGLLLQNSCGGGIDFGDINNDGYLDIAVADHCSGVYTYLNDGSNSWNISTESLTPVVKQEGDSDIVQEDENFTLNGAEDLALGDINEDGFMDIVAASADEGGLSVYLGDGTGKVWKEVTTKDGLPSVHDPGKEGKTMKGGWAHRILLHDMNGDRHLDVVATYFSGPRVWIGDGKGSWQASSEGLPKPTIGGLYWELSVGDINEDGFIDLAVANDINGPEVFLQNSDRTWQSTPDVLPSMRGGALGIDLGDLNLDGHLDMVVAGRQLQDRLGNIYGLFLCLGDGKGGWSLLDGTNLPTQGLSVTWGVEIVDVNKDGLLDIAVSTGGAVPGNFEETAIPELSLPRIQVWTNRFVSSVHR